MELPPRRRFARDRAAPPDELLTVSTEVDRGRVWLRLAGEFDLGNATRLREIVRELERLRPHTIVFDLRGLVSSTPAGSASCSSPAAAVNGSAAACCWRPRPTPRSHRCWP